MKLSALGANTGVAALASLLDGGAVELLDADGVPLARCGLGVPAFRPPVNGEAEAFPLSPDRDAAALGKPVSYRTLTADGQEIASGEVSQEEPGELVFPPPLVVPHAEVSILRYVLTLRGKP